MLGFSKKSKWSWGNLRILKYKKGLDLDHKSRTLGTEGCLNLSHIKYWLGCDNCRSALEIQVAHTLYCLPEIFQMKKVVGLEPIP